MKESQANRRKIPFLRKRRSSSTSEVEEFQKILQPPLRERPSSETDLSKAEKQIVAEPSKGRFQTSFSSSEYFSHYDSSSKLTEQAKHLSKEQMEALEIDILKPLDFFELLFKRMKIKDNEGRSGQTEDKSEGQISSEWEKENGFLPPFLNVNLILSYLRRCRKTMLIYNVMCDFNSFRFSVDISIVIL